LPPNFLCSRSLAASGLLLSVEGRVAHYPVSVGGVDMLAGFIYGMGCIKPCG
jgi:hypothetical protein